MKIGILGGSFHPIHNGHLDMARSARDAMALDKVIFMPDRIPPHKALSAGASSEDRLHMVRLACQEEPGFIASDWELSQSGISYTAFTLQHFAQEYQNDELYFIMGSDMLRSLSTWYHPEIVCKLAHLLCICRAGQSGGEKEAAAVVEQQFGAKVTLLPPVLELSSTEIRNRIAACKPISGLVPESVERYIYSHALYADEPFPALTKAMAETLKPSRFEHVIGVEMTAVELADTLQLDGQKAKLAALLHDCAKNLPVEEQRALANRDTGSIRPTEVEAVLHAPAGAVLAKERYGITDEEVLQAIRYHTTGEADMTLLDKVIWAADLIEPGRTIPRKQEYRKLLLSAKDEADFDKGFLLVFQDNICYIQSKKDSLYDPATLRARDALVEKINGKGEQHGSIE